MVYYKNTLSLKALVITLLMPTIKFDLHSIKLSHQYQFVRFTK